MSGRESLISVGLAVVVLVGIIDAAAGHGGSSGPTATPPPAGPVSTTPHPGAATPKPTARPGRHHRVTPTASTSPSSSASAAAGTTTSAPATSPASTTSSATGYQLPPGVLGTFTYKTSGYEQTSIPGTKRTFPSTTTITNTLRGCGVASTWKPVPEHTQTQVLCPAGKAIKITSYQTTISFFGIDSGENFTCSGASYLYQPGARAGQSWTYRCKAADATASQRATVVGIETEHVGGKSVRTLHVHVATTLKGANSGTSAQDYWIATDKPVLVKETGTVAATQQGVHYSSSYSLALTSLSPKA